MFRRCSMPRRCLWLAVPLVGAHLGCVAIPLVTAAVGAPALTWICGQGKPGPGPLPQQRRPG